MHAADLQRPPTLYRYSTRHWLERALRSGEFCLQPSTAGFLRLSLSQGWSERIFSHFPQTDCCLAIHDTEQFGERLHRAVQRLLPHWAGIDAAVAYGQPSPLGAAFTKSAQYKAQQEWLFAWRSAQAPSVLSPIVVRIGSIEDFAELRDKGSRQTA